MPLQNRVDPWGNISSTAERGTLLGNRGILHNASKELVKSHQHQSWVTCQLKFKGRKRKLMSPGNYTELFFLDEATAFAAGHRPCSECRRKRYLEFKELWVKTNLKKQANEIKVYEVNKIMHKERISGRTKITFKSKPSELPDGSFFTFNASAYLVFQAKYYLWSFAGYSLPTEFNFPETIDVLTPKSVVETFKQGFKPEIHPSMKTGSSL